VNNDPAIAIGAIVTIVTGFGVIAKLMLNQASKDRDDDRQERLHLAGAIERMAAATERTASEAKERNGHLAELVAKTAEKTIDTIQTIGKQTIAEQNIEHQTINTKESK
jgi:hypothetical protein